MIRNADGVNTVRVAKESIENKTPVYAVRRLLVYRVCIPCIVVIIEGESAAESHAKLSSIRKSADDMQSEGSNTILSWRNGESW
jgi:hypothetical protein